MYIMWKDRSNSLHPRDTWKNISSAKAEQYLKNHFKGEKYMDVRLLLALGQVVETPTFKLKERA